MSSDAAAAILQEAERRADGAEVFFESGETLSVSFQDNRLRRVSARQFRGVGLRVFAGGRIGFASTTDLREPPAVVEMALQSARFGERPRFELPPPPANLPDVPTEDTALRRVSPERLVEMGREGLELSTAASQAYLFSADISTHLSSTRILNTSGLDVVCAKTDMAAVVEVKEVTDDGLLEVHEFKSWGRPFESLADITRTALKKMRQGRQVTQAKAERMPVIFTPKAAGVLIEPLLLALNGKHVQKGSSVLAGRLGERVLDERLSIADDATIPFAPASGPTDDEGVPARRLRLFKDGVLESYLLDLQVGGLLGLESTGNGHRSYASRPAPSPSNTVVAPGTDAYEDMVASMERGLIVDQTLGSGQSNTLAGEFSVNVALGFLVEGGKIRGRAKDCMVAGNVYELLARVEGIGRERQWVGADCLPAICVSGIKLAASR